MAVEVGFVSNVAVDFSFVRHIMLTSRLERQETCSPCDPGPTGTAWKIIPVRTAVSVPKCGPSGSKRSHAARSSSGPAQVQLVRRPQPRPQGLQDSASSSPRLKRHHRPPGVW
ncbi:unnamed protein product [Lota lota]